MFGDKERGLRIKIFNNNENSAFSIYLGNSNIDLKSVSLLKKDRDFYFVNENDLIVSSRKVKNFILGSLRSSYQSVLVGNFIEIQTQGVGYRFQRTLNSRILLLILGHSHRILIKVPKDINFQVTKTRLLMFSFKKNLLNNFAYFIKCFRYPDAYKAKGLKFSFDKFKLKEGKKRQR